MVLPSGFTRAKYSPLESSMKFVCNSLSPRLLFLPLAKTINLDWGGTSNEGKVHLFRIDLLSVKCHPPILKASAVVLVISIQSDFSESSSVMLFSLLARNSVILNCPCTRPNRIRAIMKYSDLDLTQIWLVSPTEFLLDQANYNNLMISR